MSKRPIDKKRDAAFSIRIGDDDDQSPLTDFYNVGDKRLLHIKENGIYELRLADDIDPDRTNIELKPTQSRVLDVGSSDPLVQHILVTAKTLLRKPGHLGANFDYAAAQEIGFEMLRHLVSLRSANKEMHDAQNSAWARFKAEKQGRGATSMPSIPDVEFRGRAFFQKCGNLLRLIEAFVRLFCPEITKKWLDSLERIAIAGGDKTAPLAQLITENKSFLTVLRNTRDAIEHETTAQRFVVDDFSMTPGGEIVAPKYQLIHSRTPVAKAGLAITMTKVAEDMVGICELFMGFLCLAKVESFAGFPLAVMPAPEEMRGRGSTFHYATFLEGEWRVLG